METVESLRQKADHYRRLADGILSKTDPTRVRLLERAVDCERKAAAMEAEESERQLIAGALNDDGYSVATTPTVADAVRELCETEFGAALTDCLLPNGDCAEVITAAEARPVPVILMSGDPEQIDTAAGRPFLAKPFSVAELQTTLRAMLT